MLTFDNLQQYTEQWKYFLFFKQYTVFFQFTTNFVIDTVKLKSRYQNAKKMQ